MATDKMRTEINAGPTIGTAAYHYSSRDGVAIDEPALLAALRGGEEWASSSHSATQCDSWIAILDAENRNELVILM